ncbi:monovalent cation/H(+) antiporter subunit G [Paeniroseomonas aquatica]|uniref:Monovalent cation/H(+) antiporter subunit G n=1 Tax=Paeniroseomonas aquatica TaxID=373043 RepID=A0ABT8AC58_9PROT|nr:monovalent cation/H(+) antiporter subunit G [Paeniroseomonas aquatica]MDN3567407.1 monovalent cation/H(+) antiporter subunit G [Paeniroseomonas aquatica]
MSHAAELPIWLAVPAALLLLLGAGLALTGALGLLRLRTFYERLHAPTIGTSYGMGCVLLASVLVFSARQGRPVLHEVLIGLFVVVTTPVTLMLLGRAALHRDRLEGDPEVPGAARPDDAPPA